MPYYAATGGDPTSLLIGILSLVMLVIISLILINLKIKDKKIKVFFYIMLLVQISIVFIDNYIMVFPLMGFDPRAFEGMAWFSYINNTNVGRGAYNYYILNPIYKLIKVRSATIFGVVNIFCNIITNINIYDILKELRIKKSVLRLVMLIAILSPISLIFRSGVLREAIIIMFISYSLKSFVRFCIEKDILQVIKSFIFVFLGTIFHGGVVFTAVGYFMGILGGEKNKKTLQYIFFIVVLIGFIIFKDQLLEEIGGGDIDKTVQLASIYSSLNDSSSGYLRGVDTKSLGQLIMYLPLLIFYFLYSPTPEMFRGVLDILTFVLNSTIFIYFTAGTFYFYLKEKKRFTLLEKKIIKCLTISSLLTIIVFSVATRNFGTAIRHRDKILPILTVVFAISRNRYIYEKEKKNERTY